MPFARLFKCFISITFPNSWSQNLLCFWKCQSSPCIIQDKDPRMSTSRWTAITSCAAWPEFDKKWVCYSTYCEICPFIPHPVEMFAPFSNRPNMFVRETVDDWSADIFHRNFFIIVATNRGEIYYESIWELPSIDGWKLNKLFSGTEFCDESKRRNGVKFTCRFNKKFNSMAIKYCYMCLFKICCWTFWSVIRIIQKKNQVTEFMWISHQNDNKFWYGPTQQKYRKNPRSINFGKLKLDVLLIFAKGVF